MHKAETGRKGQNLSSWLERVKHRCVSNGGTHRPKTKGQACFKGTASQSQLTPYDITEHTHSSQTRGTLAKRDYILGNERWQSTCQGIKTYGGRLLAQQR